MTAPDVPCFLDTNIFVYAYETAPSHKQAVARRLILDLTATDRPRISSQVVQELYYTLVTKLHADHEEALDYLDRLAGWSLWKNGFEEVREAGSLSRRSVISFWDALIVVAAARSGAALLYTEDLNHAQMIEGVRIVNPFVQN